MATNGICDECGKLRKVTSVGRDANGDPDAPDICFLCLEEGKRGKTYDKVVRKYVRQNMVTVYDKVSSHTPRVTVYPRSPFKLPTSSYNE